MFKLTDFSGGISAEYDSGKRPVGTLPAIFNARVRRNTVYPIRKHVIYSGPSGNYQGLYAAGQYLVLVGDGSVWTADTTANPMVFTLRAGGVFNANVEYVYGCTLPEGTSQLAFDGSTATDNKQVVVSATPSPRGLLLMDGISRPGLLLENGVFRNAASYAEWSLTVPEYVPIGVNPVISGTKLFMLSSDRKKIYHSVSGRVLDFVVNRSATGAGGDADTTSKSISYDAITALLPGVQGGLVACTPFATYNVYADFDNTMFGEPMLRESVLFPVGAVNHVSFAHLGGDLAVITQGGLTSFNLLQSTTIEQRDNPLSAPIFETLTWVQDKPAAITVDNYVYFSLDTVYGKGVYVYDLVRKKFVSFDLEFGWVKMFASVRYGNTNRLFYITWNNEIKEVGVTGSPATARVYVGDFQAENQHRLQAVRAQFQCYGESGNCRIAVCADGKPQEVELRTIPAGLGTQTPPVGLPYPGMYTPYTTIVKPLSRNISEKSGVLLEWNAEAELVSVGIEITEDKRVVPAAETLTNSVLVEDTYAVMFDAGVGYGTDWVAAVEEIRKCRGIFLGGLLNTAGYNSFLDKLSIYRVTNLADDEYFLTLLGQSRFTVVDNYIGIVHDIPAEVVDQTTWFTQFPDINIHIAAGTLFNGTSDLIVRAGSGFSRTVSDKTIVTLGDGINGKWLRLTRQEFSTLGEFMQGGIATDKFTIYH